MKERETVTPLQLVRRGETVEQIAARFKAPQEAVELKLLAEIQQEQREFERERDRLLSEIAALEAKQRGKSVALPKRGKGRPRKRLELDALDKPRLPRKQLAAAKFEADELMRCNRAVRATQVAKVAGISRQMVNRLRSNPRYTEGYRRAIQFYLSEALSQQITASEAADKQRRQERYRAGLLSTEAHRLQLPPDKAENERKESIRQWADREWFQQKKRGEHPRPPGAPISDEFLSAKAMADFYCDIPGSIPWVLHSHPRTIQRLDRARALRGLSFAERLARLRAERKVKS